jgi:DNA adenine methylase
MVQSRFDNAPLKPPLKWAGGKRWLTPLMSQLWGGHECRRMVEPFAGGLAIALALRPDRAVLNDANPHLINFLTWIQRGLHIELPMENQRATFYTHRERFNELARSDGVDSSEAAALFYYLNRTCFNGLCRFNSRGEFNVPFGRYKTINYAREFTEYSRAMVGWTLAVGDFEGTALEPDDFIYADPPYDVQFTQYSKVPFSWEDQVRLAEWLSRHEGPVVLSNQSTPRILELYKRTGFNVRTLEAPRMISSSGDRSPALEVLATRNL